MKTIDVSLKNESYQVFIEKGLLAKIDQFITDKSKLIIVTDDLVPKQYIEQVRTILKIEDVITFPHGENHKTMATVESIIDQCQSFHLTRGDGLIALGGGIVGDITGFVASIYLRGIDYYNIPTTLLSQIDSSVGGKVGVNSKVAKNAIGQFKQPKAVFIDPLVLSTLDQRQFNNGMAELIKHALIKDESLFNDLLDHTFDENQEEFIYRSISIKKDVVMQDVFDHDERQVLNFGHTLAHAIEKASNHQILHGEAVSIGMACMSKKSQRYQDVLALLYKYQLPTSSDYDYLTLEPFMKNDKKLKQDILTLVLLDDIGQAYLKKGEVKDLKEYL